MAEHPHIDNSTALTSTNATLTGGGPLDPESELSGHGPGKCIVEEDIRYAMADDLARMGLM